METDNLNVNAKSKYINKYRHYRKLAFYVLNLAKMVQTRGVGSGLHDTGSKLVLNINQEFPRPLNVQITII